MSIFQHKKSDSSDTICCPNLSVQKRDKANNTMMFSYNHAAKDQFWGKNLQNGTIYC